MILTLEKITDLIKNPKNKDFLRKAQEINEQHELHINGCGLKEFITAKAGVENTDALNIRLQETLPFTVPIMANVLKPFDKALKNGLVNNFNFKKPEIAKIFEEEADYYSDFVISNWSKYVKLDPNGLIFMEISKDGLEIYPTYKSSSSIYDIFFDLSYDIQYVIFKPVLDDKNIKHYRVLDELFDYDIIESNGQISINEFNTIPNPFMEVPACFISSKLDNKTKTCFTSYFSDALIKANEYLDYYSIAKVYEIKQGFPLHWQIKISCPACQGTGKYFEKFNTINSQETVCLNCNGSGIGNKNRKISDILTIDVNSLSQGDADPRNQPAGFVSPDLDTLRLMYERLDYLEIQIDKAVWGGESAIKKTSQNKTAFEVSTLNQNYHDKLSKYSDNASEVYEFICESAAKVKYPENYIDIEGHYVKRFGLKSAEELLNEYTTAQTAKVSDIILNTIYKEYLSVLYEADENELKTQLLILDIKPFFHYQLADLLLIKLDIDKNDFLGNLYFNDFLNTFTGENPFYIYSKVEIDILLDEFINNLTLQLPINKPNII